MDGKKDIMQFINRKKSNEKHRATPFNRDLLYVQQPEPSVSNAVIPRPWSLAKAPL